jgi:hypothetical protein
VKGKKLREELYSLERRIKDMAPPAPTPVYTKDVDIQLPREILQQAQQIQAKDIDILNQGNRALEEAVQIGGATLEVLQKQGEALQHVEVNLATVEDNATRSKNTLKKFATKIANDKCLWIIGAVLTCILVPTVGLPTRAVNGTIIA